MRRDASEKNANLELLFHTLKDGVCISDGVGNLIYANPSARSLLGLPEKNDGDLTLCQALCGRLRTAPQASPCDLHCPLKENGASQQAVTFEGQWQAGGPPLDKGLRVRCLKMPHLPESAQKQRHFTIIEDTSDSLELKKKKETWRHMVAHDLRSPLTNVLLALYMVQEDEKDSVISMEKKEWLSAAVRSCQRMMSMLDLYLDIARLEGDSKVERSCVDIAQMAKRSIQDQDPFAGLKKIQVSLDAPAGLQVHAQPDLLFRVMQNLLNNALKFSPAGGQVAITVKTAPERRVQVSFKDNGPGIAKRDLPHIFESFYQARMREEGRTHGSGLGLMFCKEALAAMGGEISVSSAEGFGSEFKIQLPSV